MYTHIRTHQKQTRAESHPLSDLEHKTASTQVKHPNQSGETDIPDAPEIAPVAADDGIDLESIPVHVLGLDAIKKGAPIGCGGMSTVFSGKLGTTPVALKQTTNDSVQILLNEAEMLTKINHRNVIKVFGIWKNAEQQVFMVLIALL